jgi:hypothetical protein
MMPRDLISEAMRLFRLSRDDAYLAVGLDVRLFYLFDLSYPLAAHLAEQLLLGHQLPRHVVALQLPVSHQSLRPRVEQPVEEREAVADPVEEIAPEDDRGHQHEASGDRLVVAGDCVRRRARDKHDQQQVVHSDAANLPVRDQAHEEEDHNVYDRPADEHLEEGLIRDEQMPPIHVEQQIHLRTKRDGQKTQRVERRQCN